MSTLIFNASPYSGKGYITELNYSNQLSAYDAISGNYTAVDFHPQVAQVETMRDHMRDHILASIEFAKTVYPKAAERLQAKLHRIDAGLPTKINNIYIGLYSPAEIEVANAFQQSMQL